MSAHGVLPMPTLAGESGVLAPLLVEHARTAAERLGPGPAPRVYFSPGRVNLMGGHLDYNGGPVLPMAIDRGTFLAVRPRADRRLRLASTFASEVLDAPLDELPAERTGRWYDYPLGVVRELVGRAANPTALAGVEVLFGGNLPVGAGLSSSASICVGTAFALDRSWELALEPLERVRAALAAERGFVGVRCGIMDPYAVGLARPGKALWLDCKDASWRHVPLDFDRVAVGVVDSGVQRELARGEFNRRVEECAAAFDALRAHAPDAEVLRDVPRSVVEAHAGDLPGAQGLRARHVAAEVERTFAARDALDRGDVVEVGRLVTATHASLRDLYECSCDELDVLVDAAVAAPGCFGARLTGAGFGGCVVLLVDPARAEEVRETVRDAFAARFGRTPAAAFFGGDEGPREVRVA